MGVCCTTLPIFSPRRNKEKNPTAESPDLKYVGLVSCFNGVVKETDVTLEHKTWTGLSFPLTLGNFDETRVEGRKGRAKDSMR